MQEQVRLVHITAELPPTVGGVADYTAILSRRLVEVSDGTVEPVLVHAGNESTDAIEVEVPTVDLSGECSAAALAETVRQLADESEGPAVVLLEYSGYGYAKRGAPWWLARGLRRVCGTDGVPLITMFHELYASGPPWTSAFWLSFVQARVVRRLARYSDGILANRRDTAEWLHNRASTPVCFSPVFSNVGEPGELHPWEEREPYAVVFGGTGKRALYTKHGSLMTKFLDRVGINRVVDIGPSPPDCVGRQDGIQVDIRGLLSPEEVSKSISNAQIGFLCRNPEALTKSGSLAAYFAHGVPSVIAHRHSSEANPILEEGTHYISMERAVRNTIEEEEWQELGRRAREWYVDNAHSSSVADVIEQLIKNLL